MKKRLLSTILVLCMLLSVMPMSVTASDASGGISTYAELKAACAEGGSYFLTADIMNVGEGDNCAVTIPYGKTVTIDGYGHILSVPVPGLTEMGSLNDNGSDWGVFNNNGTFTIKNATLRGGTGWNAHAIDNNNAALTVEACTIERTYARYSFGSGSGAGIYNHGSMARAVIRNTKISRNAAGYGGGALNSGGIMIAENSSLNENRSMGMGYGGGGLENNGNGILIMNNCTIANNTSSEIGGAINNYGANAYLFNVTAVGNITANDGGYGDPAIYGGAIGCHGDYQLDYHLYIANSLVVNNYACYDNHPEESYPSDVSLWSGGSAEAVGCGFGTIVFYNVESDFSGKTIATTGNMTGYYASPILDNSNVTLDFDRPIIMLGENNTYIAPVKSNSEVSTGGVNTYVSLPTSAEEIGFNEDGSLDLSCIRLGYGDEDDIQSFDDRFSAATVEDKVTKNQDGTNKVEGAIGSYIVDDQTYVTLTAIPTEHGSITGISRYGDAFVVGTEVTIEPVPNEGCVFEGWYFNDDGSYLEDNLRSTEEIYTFTASEDAKICAKFVCTHDYIWEETSAATCTAPAYQHEICTRCYDVRTENVPVEEKPAMGHNYVWEETSAATCTAPAYQHEICTRCYDVRTENVPVEEKPALGHEMASSETVASTEEAPYSGYEVFKCSRCEYSYKRTVAAYGEGYNVSRAWIPVANAGDTAYPESKHDYDSYSNDVKVYTVPGAEKLRFTFSNDSKTEDYWDNIYIYQGSGVDKVLKYTLTGYNFKNQSFEIEGDTATIVLTSDGSYQYYGYSFSSIEQWGFDEAAKEAVGSANDDLIYSCSIENNAKEVDQGTNNGYITVADHAAVGAPVEVSLFPAEGYCVDGVYYNDGEDHVIEKVDGKYTFTMPAADVTVCAAFHAHTYTEVSTWNWSSSGARISATAVFKCNRCDEGEEVIPATVASTTADGYITYTASVTLGETEYTTSKTDAAAYTLNVVNGTVIGGLRENGVYYYNDLITVQADEPEAGKYFAGWYLNDVKISDSKTYKFYLKNDTQLEAKYEDAPVEVSPLVALELSDRIDLTGGQQQVKLVVRWELPSGYQPVEAGFVRTYEKGNSDSLTLENVDGTDIKKNSVAAVRNTGGYTLNLSATTALKNLYYVGYLKCTNAAGETITVYTDLAKSNAKKNLPA